MFSNHCEQCKLVGFFHKGRVEIVLSFHVTIESSKRNVL